MATRPGPTYQGPRGRCSECGKTYALRADGTMRLHRSDAAGFWFCPGAGKPPGDPAESGVQAEAAP